MKKSLSIMLVFLMALTLLSACSSNNEEGTTSSSNNDRQQSSSTAGNGNEEEGINGSITVLWNRTDLADGGDRKYVDGFKAKYPNADVKFEAVVDYDQTAKIRLSSGEFPDVILIPSIPNSELSEYFEPLDDLGLNDRIYFNDAKGHDGELYGIAIGASTVGIVYNKQTFADAGITKVPTTLDEFYEAAEKLKEIGVIPFASNFMDQWPLYPFATELATAMSGDPEIFNKRKESDAPYSHDSEIVKAMSIARTIYERGFMEVDINSTNWEQSKIDLANGKFAMFYLGNWVIPQIIDSGTTSDNVGFFPFPYDNSGDLNVTLAPDWSFGVNKNSKALETAKAFVKWMTEESGYANDAGFIPTLKELEPTVEQLKQFNNFNPTYIELVADDPITTEINNRAQIVKEGVIQEYILANDVDEMLNSLNKKWAQARTTILEQ